MNEKENEQIIVDEELLKQKIEDAKVIIQKDGKMKLVD